MKTAWRRDLEGSKLLVSFDNKKLLNTSNLIYPIKQGNSDSCKMKSDLYLRVLILNTLAFAGATSNLTPVGQVYYCPGEPLVFTCKVARVSSQSSIESLRWTVHFQEVSLSDVRPSYLASDNEGHTQMFPRDGHQFVFNLTVNSQSELVSTLTVTVSNDSASTINNATVTCGEDSHQNARIAAQGVPVSPIIVNQTVGHDEDKSGAFTFILKWNSSDEKMVNGYIISVSSQVPVIPEVSTFTTNNTSIEISILYNQEYNICVMASNCAGNSIAAETIITIGYCNLPNIGPNVTIRGEGSGVEGTQISYYCQENPISTEELMSTCMSDGRWSPDPIDLVCLPNNVHNNGSKKLSNDSYSYVDPERESTSFNTLILILSISIGVASFLFLLLGLLIGVVLTMCSLKCSSRIKTKMEPQVPVYEEVNIKTTATFKLEDNVAYGHIR